MQAASKYVMTIICVLMSFNKAIPCQQAPTQISEASP